ncbi:hypothetical protein ACLOJK_029736 [Asimina triloba]
MCSSSITKSRKRAKPAKAETEKQLKPFVILIDDHHFQKTPSLSISHLYLHPNPFHAPSSAIMYIKAIKAAAASPAAARIRFPSLHLSRTLSPSSNARSLSFSRSGIAAFQSPILRSSAPWQHGSAWRSPLSLRAQVRSSAAVIERFERKMSTVAAFLIIIVLAVVISVVDMALLCHASGSIGSASENAFKGILTSLPKPGGGEFGKFYSLTALNDPRIDRLPYSIRILLESAIRNCDNFQVTKDDVEKIIDWEKTSPKQVEIPFKPARDFTGVPAVVDLASMRDSMNNLGSDSNKINPLVPVDLVIDHSVQVDVARSENAVQANMELEFQRNKERFAFLKWGSTAFRNMLVVPPGSGIVHQLVMVVECQVNLEYLGRVVFNTDGILYPDSVVGTDSHTTMIDGLGVAGWGVGGIEAEAAMLGQDTAIRYKPFMLVMWLIYKFCKSCFVGLMRFYASIENEELAKDITYIILPMSMVLPGVVGFKLTGKLCDGVTATDLVLTVTQILRKHGVVGKFVEFYGGGMGELSLADRATIANMSPEYGATMGFFPVDHVTLQYLKLTGRSDETVGMIEAYLRANKMFVDYTEPQTERVYSSYLELDLADVEPCVSGPKRCVVFGFAVPKESQDKVVKFSFHGQPAELKHGSVVIAAITSCTNTSNPSVMLGAGLVSKKAYELGLQASTLTVAPRSTLSLLALLKDNCIFQIFVFFFTL